MRPLHRVILSALAGVTLSVFAMQAQAAPFTMEQVLHYPYAMELASAEHADRIGWVRDLAGVRNVWVADGPAFQAAPRDKLY